MDVNVMLNQLLESLHNPRFGLQEAEIQRLELLASRVKIYHLKSSDEPVNIPLYDIAGEWTTDVAIRNRSQVIDIVPCFNNGSFHEMKPVLILIEHKSDAMQHKREAMHELCHLFSVSPYIPHEGDGKIYFTHTYGINEYVYHMEHDRLKLMKHMGNTVINEFMNDYVGVYFMQLLYKMDYYTYQALKIFSEYISDRQQKTDVDNNLFIQWYFTGQTKKIQHFLLGEHFDKYDDLCSSLGFCGEN